MDKLHKHTKGAASFTMISALVIVVVLIYLLIRLILSSSFIDPDEADPLSTSGRIQPTGMVRVGDGIPPGDRTGEQIFNKTCTQCHASDSQIADSPKFGNTEDWAPRIAKGMEALMTSALNGLNAMPARGGNNTLTDTEVERAIVYMANSAGGTFPEPSEDAQEASEENGESSEDASASEEGGNEADISADTQAEVTETEGEEAQ